MRDESHGAVGADGRGAMRRQQLLDEALGGVAGQANLPQNASEDIDEEGVLGGIDMAVRSAGERYSEMKFWRGHETRFYSESRPKSTRARAQSLAI